MIGVGLIRMTLWGRRAALAVAYRGLPPGPSCPISRFRQRSHFYWGQSTLL